MPARSIPCTSAVAIFPEPMKPQRRDAAYDSSKNRSRRFQRDAHVEAPRPQGHRPDSVDLEGQFRAVEDDGVGSRHPDQQYERLIRVGNGDDTGSYAIPVRHDAR